MFLLSLHRLSQFGVYGLAFSVNIHVISGKRHCSNVTANSVRSDGEGVSSFPAYSTRNQNIEVSDLVSVEQETTLIKKYGKMSPLMPVHSHSLIPFVNDSESLKNLLSLGVDLGKIEKNPKAAEIYLKADFEKHISPYLILLQTFGISRDSLGVVISRFPLIIREDMEVLKSRWAFLKVFGFSTPGLGQLLSTSPKILQVPIKDIEKSLSFLASEFKLSETEIVAAATKCSRLITYDLKKMEYNKLFFKEMASFSSSELKTMMLVAPRIFTAGQRQLMETFDYLRYVMDIKHSQMVHFPQIFRSRSRHLQRRHLFLCSVNRNQYNPKLPNYISLLSLVSGTDEQFAVNVAKTTVQKFHLFLKTL